MADEELCNTCDVCFGEYEVEGEFCTACMGTGATPLRGVLRFLSEFIPDIRDKVNDIKEKVDEIKEILEE